MHLDRFVVIGSMKVLSRLVPLMIRVVRMRNLKGGYREISNAGHRGGELARDY